MSRGKLTRVLPIASLNNSDTLFKNGALAYEMDPIPVPGAYNPEHIQSS